MTTTDDTDGQTALDDDHPVGPFPTGYPPRGFWRNKLRQYLEKRVGEPVRFGVIADAILNLIPLHNAFRSWPKRRDRENTWAITMRVHCLKTALAEYPLQYSPERNRATPFTWDVLITPQNRPCAHCGKLFFGKRKTRCCGRACSAAIGRAVAAPNQADGGAELVRYDAMCQAIQAAFAMDEVKNIRDKALAIEMYSRQARNTEAERQAREIRLRAERKVGQLLRETEKAKGARGNPGGRGAPVVRSNEPTAQTLAELAISKDQSSRWQQLSAVPESEFEHALTEPKPSTSGIIARHNRLTGKKNKQLTRRRKEPTAPLARKAESLWEHLNAFVVDGLLEQDPDDLLATMTDVNREETLHLANEVSQWLVMALNGKVAGELCRHPADVTALADRSEGDRSTDTLPG